MALDGCEAPRGREWHPYPSFMHRARQDRNMWYFCKEMSR
jgi:hypothetical protein